MVKITFMGAGSTIFAKNILGDAMLTPVLSEAHIALYDIDPVRLNESKLMLDTLNANINGNRATITAHLGVQRRREALKGASYVINAIQVGGYKPATVIDFEIPRKYGLRQTIADTLGIGGIFRGLRTIPVMFDFAADMEKVCPDAWFLNYTNPMAILTGAMLRGTSVRTVGLCHSVQVCADTLLWDTGFEGKARNIRSKIAGINHQAWLLELTSGGKDLYPVVKRRAADLLAKVRAAGGRKVMERARKTKGDAWHTDPMARIASDMVRLEMMMQFGFYVTESSEHNAEYMPYWIKGRYPELIDEYNIPLDEYPRRCVNQIKEWKKRKSDIVSNRTLDHVRTHEYGSRIMEAIETGTPIQIGGNVMNTGLIPNLPAKACVEVPCLVDRNGVQGTYAGDLPEPCAALNRTNINVQILTVEAALSGKKDAVYHAAMMDPHTAAELSIDDIRRMCDDLIRAHGAMLPKLR